MNLIKRTNPRPIKLTKDINPYAHGSVLVEFGRTKVHITATVENTLPPWLKGQGKGWVTAEYNMLPGSTHTRSKRERKSLSGRTQEIQRFIGRALRSVVDLKSLGEKTITLDCDVLVADGGTRTASLSGAYVALKLAVDRLLKDKATMKNPLREKVAALSVGIDRKGNVIADLNYEEDSSCHTDMNIVMTDSGRFVEIQGTAEGAPFSDEELSALLDCAKSALKEVFKAQEEALRG
ncbi:MAG: ribonuclease PH [Bacteriovoracales bacterium]|nr:ribonuclease PH [Bacteriovoracales bacterium]